MGMKPPERQSIGDMFRNRYPLHVPSYQRGYAWESDEVDDFVSDVSAVYRARRGGQPRQHFLGGVVSVEIPQPETTSGRIYQLVDGQQRLATCFMALAQVLRGYPQIAKLAKAEADEVTAVKAESTATVETEQLIYTEEVDQATGKRRRYQRMRLSRADASYFEAIVNGESADVQRASHQLLREANRRVRNELVSPILKDQPLSAAERFSKLQDLLRALKDDLFVIHIGSEDREEAYRLFMTLNNRGRSLTEGELLRAWLLEVLTRYPAEQEQVERDWDVILQQQPEFVDRFLRDYFASHHGERASRKNLFEQFREKFFSVAPLPSPEEAKTISTTVGRMRRGYEAYAKLAEGDWPYDAAGASAWEQDRLDRLVTVLGRGVALPLLLAVYESCDERVFSRVLEYIERADFRYLVCGLHAGQLGDRYYAQAKRVRERGVDYDIAELKTAVTDLAGATATDEVFSAALKAQMKYAERSGGNKSLAHFLTTIDAFYNSTLRGEVPPKPEKMTVYDLKHLDIEHIYAQRAQEKSAQLEPLKHDLGNLTFWGPEDNRAESNKPFMEKRPRYRASSVSLTRAVGDFNEWTAAELDSRREQLVSIALKVFRFD